MSTTATAQQWWVEHADRHGRAWATHYWNDWQASHRHHIVLAMELLPPVTSLYEIGCNSGPNLRLIRSRFPSLTLGGLDGIPLAADLARTQLGVPIDQGMLPGALPETEWDVVLSCYTMAYLDPEDAHLTMLKLHRMAQQALILMEPFPVGGYPVGQCRDDGLPEWRHAYEKTFGALGWRVAWKWPLIPPVQHMNALLVLRKESVS